ncbi:MAG: (d)CMP kinase [bacterium]
MKKSGFIIAIDGPAGSGKSTTARLCAQQLGFCYLDTGAMYRAVTLKVIEREIDFGDEQVWSSLLRQTNIDIVWRRGNLVVKLDGRDVTEKIRSPKVSGLVSEVSAIGAVRKKMVKEQRRLAEGRNIVCEGRDIGSVVFPKAQLKIFLDCDITERVKRRERELKEIGRFESGREEVKRNLLKRDRIDSRRSISPLRRMSDAVLLDTTYLTIEEQVAIVCALARQRGAGRS